MIYSTVNHQKLPFSDPTHPPLWWRNTWMSLTWLFPVLMDSLSNLQLLTKKGSYCTWRHRTSHSSLFWESTTWSGPFSTKVEFSERISSEVGRWNKNWGFESEICFWKSNSTNIYHSCSKYKILLIKDLGSKIYYFTLMLWFCKVVKILGW